MSLAARLWSIATVRGVLSRRLPPGFGLVASLAIAMAAVGLALWFRLSLSSLIVGAQFVTFVPAVMLATLLGGFLAGVVAVALASAASTLVLSPAGHGAGYWIATSIFSTVGLMDVVIVAALLAGNAALRRSGERVSQLNADLLLSESKFRDLIETAPDAMVIADEDQQIVLVNAEAERMFGYRREQLIGQTIDMLMPEAFRGLHGPSFADFLERPRIQRMGYGRELFARRSDGHEFPIETNLNLLPGGKHGLISAAIRDVTERRAADERQALLIRELNHRVKNTLASVQAIVTQTLRTSRDPQAFSDAFTARLAALSQSHDVLTRNDWSGAFMHEILAEQLNPYERSAFDGRRVRSRFRLDGPDIKLSPNRAVTLSMAIGELATNAAKHGALSNGGSVEVEWSLETIDAAPWLSLIWQESGGPPVSPPSRTGFGTRLIERSLAGGLGGCARLDYAPDGLVCALKFPLIGDEA